MKQALVRLWHNPVARNPVKALFIGAIRGYQEFISPGLPGRCKYYPSCSQYAIDAIREYGAARGVVLAGWRILRCNPLSYGGYDPASRQRLFPTRCSHAPKAHTHAAMAASTGAAPSTASAAPSAAPASAALPATTAASGRQGLGS
jgi:putative membrane protein insertion efficiency factor